jgi:hypothetical protein
MYEQKVARNLFRCLRDGRGLATPVSMLIIFFSLTVVSTVTYYHAMSRIEAEKESLKLVAAEEKMLDLEEAVSSVAWKPGSSRVLAFSDYGGELKVEPASNHLKINVTMGASSYILFDSDTVRVLYELPSTTSRQVDRWLRGDNRAIVNGSASYLSQVRIERGVEKQELILSYRPLVSSSTGDLVKGRRVNNIRIYVVNLNSSQVYSSTGQFHLRAWCSGVSTFVNSYNLTSAISSASISATLGSSQRTVVVPIMNSTSGSTVRYEVVVCFVELRRMSV